MIFLYILLFSVSSFSLPLEFISVTNILNVHEFYKENELIQRPLDAWQEIASFSSVNKDLSLSKLCIKYRPALNDKGELKVIRIGRLESCNKSGELLTEVKNLRGIQFQKSPFFRITFTHKDYSLSHWIIPNSKKDKKISLLDTSDKYLDEGVLFLGEGQGNEKLIADGVKCLEVRDDCEVVGESTCHQCLNGFIEAPNGCAVSTQYCSSAKCGTKGNPACRRGVRVMKQRELDCSLDSRFAFCRDGATPVCQGKEVWCH